TVARRHRCAVNVMALDDAPFATRSPILKKVVVGITRIPVRMLFSIRLLHPPAVGLVIVLWLQRIEELVYGMLFRPEPEHPPQEADYDDAADDGEDHQTLLAGTRRIIGLGFEQGHANYSLLVAMGSHASEDLGAYQ